MDLLEAAAAADGQPDGHRGVMRAVKKAVVATVVVDGGPGFPLFSPDGSRLYVMVSTTGDIAVIEPATGEIFSSVSGS